MPRYRVTLPVLGDFPPNSDLSPTSIGSVELFLENNQWKVKMEFEAEDGPDALEKSRSIANSALALFQVFSSGAANFFTVYVSDDTGGVVEDLSAGLRGVVSNTVTVTVRANLAVVNIRQLRARLGQLSGVQTLALEEDCRIILYYYTTAMKEDNDTYKFLNFITTVEAMLSEVSETTEKISRRLAVLISSKYPNMQQTFEQFKRFYNTRSDILHGEKVPSISKETVNTVSEFVQASVRNYLLLRRSNSNQEIKQLLDKFFDRSTIDQIRRITSF